MTDTVTFTGSGLVTNSPDTYKAVARILLDSGTVSLGWTDNAGSHLDVWLALCPTQVGPPARMDERRDRLFVAVGGCGAFGFPVERIYPLHPGYVAEKLGLAWLGWLTAEMLTYLITGVLIAVSE